MPTDLTPLDERWKRYAADFNAMTDADIEAASEWAQQLAEKIVFGNHGSGNAAVLFDRAFEARATAAEAREAKLREALDRLIAYYDPLGHLWGNGCHHGFKPASRCENEGCEECELHRSLQALEAHTRAKEQGA